MVTLRFLPFITLFLFFLLLPLEFISVDAGLVVTGNRRILASKATIDLEKTNEEDEIDAAPVLKQKKVKTEQIIKEAVKLKKPTNASTLLLKKKPILDQMDLSLKPVKKATDLLKSPAEMKNKTAAVEKKMIPTAINKASLKQEKIDGDLSEGLVKKKKKVDDSDADVDETPIRKKKKIDGSDSDMLKPSAAAAMKNKTTVVEKKTTPKTIKSSLKQEKMDADVEQTPFKKKKKIDVGESDATVKETPIKKNTTVTMPTKKNLTPSPVKRTSKDSKPKPAKTWMDEQDDLVREFRNLPYKFQENFVPDLQRISTTSKAYLNKANREIVEGFKPIVGHRYAPMVATVTSYIFLLLPLLLVSYLFHQIREYLSLQKLLFFIHGYLGAYFTVLTLAFAFFRVEPLRFFYESSLSSYVYMQVMQTLFYVMYLLMLVLYMVVQFSTDTALWVRLAALAQTMVAAIVGLHYYSVVFHNALLHKAPRASWKSHAFYAFCFLLLSLIAKRVIDRSKKAYYHESDNGDKKS